MLKSVFALIFGVYQLYFGVVLELFEQKCIGFMVSKTVSTSCIFCRKNDFMSKHLKKTQRATENPGKMSLFWRILKNDKFDHKSPAFERFLCVKNTFN